ncbi:MAG: lysophospholipase, partial [Stellaceae bacterium]
GQKLGVLWAIIALSAAGCAPTISPDAPPRAIGTASAATDPVPHFTADRLVTADGMSLPLRKWLPDGEPRAVILALHGFNDYSHAFAGPGKTWAKDGIATYAYDQVGFGAAPERGLWPGREVLAADAEAACRILRRRYPGVPLYLLGESMGGGVAILAMTGGGGTPAPPVDGVILAAPAVWGRATMGFLPRAALWLAVRLAPGWTLTGQSLHVLASDNIPMLRALARDPLVIKATRIETVYGLVNLMDAALAAAPKLRVPLLVMYGADDQIIPHAATLRFVHELPRDPRARRSLAFYTHGYHMLLRDREGPMVVADVAGWVLDPVAPLVSGADRGTAEAFRGGIRSARFGG